MKTCSPHHHFYAELRYLFGPEWMGSLSENKHIFYPAPIWMVPLITQIDQEGGESGRWRIIKAPEGAYVWGGTAIGVSKESNQKELAWKFIEWFLLSEEGAKVNKNSVGAYLHLRELYDDPEYVTLTLPHFGAQDIGKKYLEDLVLDTTPGKLSSYEKGIAETLQLIMAAIMDDRNITGERALEMFIDEFETQYPELEIN